MRSIFRYATFGLRVARPLLLLLYWALLYARFGGADERPACYDDAGALRPCVHGSSHLLEYAGRGGIGKAVDLYTTAWCVDTPGCVEANKLQPTAEHRFALGLVEVVAITGACVAVEQRAGYTWARRLSRAFLVTRIAVGGWNTYQLFQARHRTGAR